MGRGGGPPAGTLRGAAAFAVVALAVPGLAAAEGISAYLQPSYVNEQTELTDQIGRRTRYTRDSLIQNYVLSLDEALFRNLTLALGGSFRDNTSWYSGSLAPQGETDQRATNLFSRLTLATEDLTAGIGYDRRADVQTAMPTLNNETFAGFASWRPLDLPNLDLRVSHGRTYDSLRAVQDDTVSTINLNGRYESRPMEVRYTLFWTDNLDALSHTETRSVDQIGQVTYTDTLGGRTYVYADATVDARTALTSVSGTGGTVATQRFPIAGLSFVEVFPAQPETDTLLPNPALIDGNTASSAAVDLGYSGPLAGDTNLRDLGVQFADVVTAANTFYVYVDRALPVEATTAFASGWTVYQSDDNAHWTAVQVLGPAVWRPFQNRFEITIPQTQARFLKVAVRPLTPTPAITSNPALANILVTEVQPYLVVPASQVPHRQANTAATFNGTARTAILRAPNLDWDLNVYVNHLTTPSVTTYTVTNGLTWTQRLARPLLLTARVARIDQDPGNGHYAVWQWSAGLAATPLPTLSASLSYGAQYDERTERLTQSLGLLGRGDIYKGLSAQANVALTAGTLGGGKVSEGTSANASVIVTPNAYVTLTGNWTYSATIFSGGGQPVAINSYERVGLNLTATPFAALSVSASLDRTLLGQGTGTRGTLAVSYSPLHGDLQLWFSYSSLFDTTSSTNTRIITPALRWNVRPRVYLEASYSLFDSRAAVLQTSSRVLSTLLTITL